jgi:hypothetical protein
MVTGALRPTGARSAGHEAIADASDANVVCTENFIRVDDVMESPKLAE